MKSQIIVSRKKLFNEKNLDKILSSLGFILQRFRPKLKINSMFLKLNQAYFSLHNFDAIFTAHLTTFFKDISLYLIWTLGFVPFSKGVIKW